MKRGVPGPERAIWICPDCAHMDVGHDGNYYCEASDESLCVEPFEQTVDAIRHVELIAYCTWYEELRNEAGH